MPKVGHILKDSYIIEHVKRMLVCKHTEVEVSLKAHLPTIQNYDGKRIVDGCVATLCIRYISFYKFISFRRLLYVWEMMPPETQIQ